MTAADIEAGLALCRAAGWNQLARDWELFLKLSPDGCRVAMHDSHKVVGTVTTLRYQDRFSWVGMVLVNPEHQRQGIGTGLLHEALDILKEEETVKLDATPAGREVYLKLNFVDEYQISRMHAVNISVEALPNTVARPLQLQDFAHIAKLDYKIFGADRNQVLEWNYQGAPHFAFAVAENDVITGFCLGRRGHNFNHIGPILAQDVNGATQLASAALKNCHDKPTVIDVLHHSPSWVAFIKSLGFTELRPLTRMYRGANAHPGIPEKQFAILGPEFG